MADVNIIAETREISTKGAVNKLRKNGYVPGVLYSKDMEPVIFTVPELSLKSVVYTTEMHLVNIKIGENEAIPSILKDVQFDAVTDKIVHIDFQAITKGQVIQVQVPINLTGQSVGIKEGGRLATNLHKVDVECLPKNIPSSLDVDITALNIGDSILVRDLSFDDIKILNAEDASIVAIMAPREEEEETTDDILDEAPSAEPEVIGKDDSEETEG